MLKGEILIQSLELIAAIVFLILTPFFPNKRKKGYYVNSNYSLGHENHFNKLNVLLLIGFFIPVILVPFLTLIFQSKILLLQSGKEEVFNWLVIGFFLGFGFTFIFTKICLKLVAANDYENYLDYLDFKFGINTFGMYSFVCRIFTIVSLIMILYNFYN